MAIWLGAVNGRIIAEGSARGWSDEVSEPSIAPPKPVSRGGTFSKNFSSTQKGNVISWHPSFVTAGSKMFNISRAQPTFC
jgi:hypothetical protein